ncbi:DUF4914 family protein [Zhaonella formicivorans]|uniref:DUF4914 family protein n=1 Tax=Zhaonella formicivorans TaxID=2528593 RepID=UPI0010D1676D|nr:DUF4914 family protein [Zhaonella formicivorans]
MTEMFAKFKLPPDLLHILQNTEVIIPGSREELLELALGNKGKDFYEVAYDIPGIGRIVEATVTRCKNGIAVNYTDIYMRRRDPDCMVVADKGETDKERYKDRFGQDFKPLRTATFEWLEQQPLIVLPFMAGGSTLGYPALLVAPANAGFFAAALADLQEFLSPDRIPPEFTPKAIVCVAPPFRHTHFDNKQVVVHNRRENIHELFSYNLYPGPSAKKGIYGVLLNIGETEGWVTLHGSTVKVITPYENIFTIMHEGASGGGKSEMLQQFHREADGKVLLGENIVTRERHYLEISDSSELQPVTDDMALCPPGLQDGKKRLVVTDAEAGWFIRVDHIKKYGTDPQIEELTIHPPAPLIFLNIDAAPGSTCLIWEHTLDEPGKPCPNPRVIVPRRFFPNTVNEPVEVNIRSFGVRTPPSTRDNPNYGIIGLFHVLPPSLAWLWRLVAPRGHSNPSITDTEGMTSEGVGSYWPFATGKMVDQANLLLEQIMDTPSTRYILIPNQYIGVFRVGFMAEWMAREYIARRGSSKFRKEQLTPAKCPLLGYALDSLKIDGTYLPKVFLQVDLQPEVGEEGYQAGAKILTDFFKRELQHFLTSELHPVGRQIIEACLSDAKLDEYVSLIPCEYGN